MYLVSSGCISASSGGIFRKISALTQRTFRVQKGDYAEIVVRL